MPKIGRIRDGFVGCLAVILLMLGSSVTNAQEQDWRYCWSDEKALELFNSREWANHPNYSEHPNTHLFGQIKIVDSIILCQYSNHVGLVFTVYAQDAITKKEDKCDAKECRSEPHWRSEWIEGKPQQDDPKRTHLDVCVIELNEIAYPSVGCAYSVPKQ